MGNFLFTVLNDHLAVLATTTHGPCGRSLDFRRDTDLRTQLRFEGGATDEPVDRHRRMLVYESPAHIVSLCIGERTHRQTLARRVTSPEQIGGGDRSSQLPAVP